MVDSMFDMFWTTRAIVFDGRGYPHETGLAIARRLHSGGPWSALRSERPIVASPDMRERRVAREAQQIAPSDKPTYEGRTVMLIDERSISQTESTALLLEAANHTFLVGSPTAGAEGESVEVLLPGGYAAHFSSFAAADAAGRLLQRRGLTPRVLARPTIAGIRAGRDEVLERALATLGRDSMGKSATTRRNRQ
jgi:C-terminal processing protease CtpA/Prc